MRIVHSKLGKKGFPRRDKFDLNPKLNDLFKGAQDVWDNSMVAAYRTKGLRAWHDHLILHLQKNIYFICLVISLIFLVNEAQVVHSDPCDIDFFFVFTPMIWASGLDGLAVVCNAVFLCTRTVHEHHLEDFKEPKMIERILLHVIPIPAVICIALVAYSFPRCILTNDFIETNYCQSFTYSVLKAVLIVTLVVVLLHSVYGLYQMRSHSSVLESRGKQPGGSMKGEFLPLANESGDSGDETDLFVQQKGKTSRRTKT
jgi:hypothetical protein